MVELLGRYEVITLQLASYSWKWPCSDFVVTKPVIRKLVDIVDPPCQRSKSRMRHFKRSWVFPGQYNTTFFKTLQLLKNFKMADLDILQSLTWYNILHCLNIRFYTQKESKIENVHTLHIKLYTICNFPGHCNKVVCGIYDFLILHIRLYYTDGEI